MSFVMSYKTPIADTSIKSGCIIMFVLLDTTQTLGV